MASRVAQIKKVKPILSTDLHEARRRAVCLYKAFYRYIPYILRDFDIPKNAQDVRWKIRENFYKNALITDVRVIDVLVLKGYMELAEIRHTWQQKGHVMKHWNPSASPKPHDFLSKFLSGVD